MKTIHDPVEILQKELQTWGTPFVELDCFGTASAERIIEMLDEFCRSYFGSNLRGYLFYSASIGSTHGVQLEDGREFVIKVRPPTETNPYLSFDRASLKPICSVMRCDGYRSETIPVRNPFSVQLRWRKESQQSKSFLIEVSAVTVSSRTAERQSLQASRN